MKAKLLSIFFLSLCLSASASLLVYDDFDYPNGGDYDGTNIIDPVTTSTLTGQTGISNYTVSQSWMSGTIFDSVGGLSYSDGTHNVPATGGAVNLRNARGFEAVFSSAHTNGTYYSGFMFETSAKNGSNEWRANFKMLTSSGIAFRLGYGQNGDFTDNAFQYHNGAWNNTATMLTENTTYFVVAKMVMDGSGRLTDLDVWLNPSDLESETGSGSALISLTGQALGFGGLSGFQFEKNNLSGGEDPSFDEFRLGTTWQDATAVPEPGVYASILGITALLFVAYRRKRK